MTTVLLIRHGRTKANADGILAGWKPGVLLDAVGRKQAAAMAERLEGVRIPRIVSSPLERTMATADAIAAFQRRKPLMDIDDRFGEAHYGDWTGKPLLPNPCGRSCSLTPAPLSFPVPTGSLWLPCPTAR